MHSADKHFLTFQFLSMFCVLCNLSVWHSLFIDWYVTFECEMSFVIYRCVVVEDSAIGLAAAKSAGMKCIVTKSGYISIYQMGSSFLFSKFLLVW